MVNTKTAVSPLPRLRCFIAATWTA